MLYCPKCQQTYEERTQRFCTNEGARLLPIASSSDILVKQSGVFANVLNRKASGKNDREETFSTLAEPAEIEQNWKSPQAFRPPATSKIFKQELDLTPKIEPQAKEDFNSKSTGEEKVEKTPTVQKPLPRITGTHEILDVEAILSDRKINPTGRLALTRDNTDVLLGQTLKERFYITEKISEDQAVVAYIAEDKNAEDEKILLKVLLDEEAEDKSAAKIFAEERASLVEINHPNLAKTIDSGGLPEGKPFIATELIEAVSVKDMLARNGQFNALRTARIVRQTAYALSEAHRNNILHRDLSPANILLPISEDGAEQVKLVGFGVSKGKIKPGNLAYKAPEQIAGKIPTVAGDIYSLAAIAFEMLTNRLPFEAFTPSILLENQQNGLKLSPTNLRLDITPIVDEIIEKALAFNPSERYLKASEFGDALFNALTTTTLWSGDAEKDEPLEIKLDTEEHKALDARPIEIEESTLFDIPSPSFESSEETFEAENLLAATGNDISNDFHISENGKKAAKLIPAIDANWESPLPPVVKPAPAKTSGWVMPSVLGALLILSALGFGYWMYNRPAQREVAQEAPAQKVVLPEQNVQNVQVANPTPAPIVGNIEPAPAPLEVKTAPPDTTFFENSKQNLKSGAAKNFLGFSLYYPNGWKQNDAKNNFLDISKNAPTGTPIEQMLVSYYDSKGNLTDDKKVFPSLVKETNSTLKNIVPDYKLVSQGEKTINGGLKAYEVRFTGKGKTAKGEDIKLWGRRLFVPTARDGAKNGYVLTMLATSLSPEVKSLDDVGVKGELRTVLDTFTPKQD